MLLSSLASKSEGNHNGRGMAREQPDGNRTARGDAA